MLLQLYPIHELSSNFISPRAPSWLAHRNVQSLLNSLNSLINNNRIWTNFEQILSKFWVCSYFVVENSETVEEWLDIPRRGEEAKPDLRIPNKNYSDHPWVSTQLINWADNCHKYVLLGKCQQIFLLNVWYISN